MTDEQWQKVANRLATPFMPVHLMVDGYKLTLEVHQEKPLKFVIVPFVNGWSKGEWLINKTEEAKRFFRLVKRPVYSPSQKKKLTKGFSKTNLKKYFPDINRSVEYYNSFWPSFAPLKRHLIANNKSIELLED